ncbi:MAG: hypothetical protein M1838_000337 [Thelocarpon superellum]|nr:MAG: hypothetical protein M1838_000337 [Thelocarpon superellum]
MSLPKLVGTALVTACLVLLVSGNSEGVNRRSTFGPFSFPSLINVTVDELALGLDLGLFTSVDLVKTYLARIDEVNGQLNAVTEINPDAISIAENLDNERKRGITRGPLSGIPLLVKGNIGTADKMNTTAGSYALLGATLPRDSGVAAKLRAAGVIILGKANLSQWANYRSSNSSNGWSAYGGQCKGAYYPNQDPSGSSSGSAVGSSIGLALAALGTETDGSILSPSEVNNLVGIKPTVGLTSRALVVPISEHQDTVGPLARTVRDAAYILTAIAGKDPNDNYTSAIPFQTIPNYVKSCKVTGLRGARIGVPRNGIYFVDNTTAAILTAFDAAIKTISDAGATVVDNTNFSAIDEILNSSNESIVLNADFVTDLPENYLSKLVTNPENVHDLVDVRNYTIKDPREDYPDRDVAIWDGALAQGFNNTDPRFWEAYQADLFLGGEGGVLGALERNNLDALILPTYISPSFAAIAGLPVVTVPLGFYPAAEPITKNQPRQDLVETAPGIPFGISFLGRAFSEAQLISYAYAFEQRTHVRNQRQPYLEPKTELDVHLSARAQAAIGPLIQAATSLITDLTS